MARYARWTSVTRGKSREQIEALLRRYGAEFINTNDINPKNLLMVCWTREGMPYKFELQLPAADDPEFTHSPTGKNRKKDKVAAEHDQAIRQFWRIAYQYLYMLHELMGATGMEFRQAYAPLAVMKGGNTVWQNAAAVDAKALSDGVGLEALMPPAGKE